MKLRKLSIALILTVLIGLGFSSCRNDYYWKQAQLDFYSDPVTDRVGYFEQRITIYDTDINGFTPSREDLVDVRLTAAILRLSSPDFKRGDVIYDFMIDLPGVDYYEYPPTNRPLGVMSSGDYFEFRDDYYFRVMSKVVDQLRYRGRVDIVVSGHSNMPSNLLLDFDFKNNIDIQVRD